jgi:hypothetical protein
MPAGKYFAYAAELMKLQPPHITDQPIIDIFLVFSASFG